jgi:mono/diheme cytochrome c family protein
VRALRLLGPLTIATALFAATACGGGGHKQAQAGESSGVNPAGAKVFDDAGCGDCHTLASANSKGTVGPNLDQLRPNEDRVRRQVESGGGGMPSFKDKLSQQDINNVAAYVSSVAGS